MSVNASANISLGVAGFGLLLLLFRMWPRRPRAAAGDPSVWPLVSIVVPARNEEAVLSHLLSSLQKLDYPDYEVIVVDDCSEDATAAIAAAHGARVISGQERAAGWHGKQWACAQGAGAARGDYLLFTDADTVHRPSSLRLAIREMIATRADGFTALPEHICQDWWEKLCGPFHVLLLAATNPYGQARPGQVYAIGQYLIFERQAYVKLGGHARVKDDWVEDIPLAQALLRDGGRWHVHRGEHLFAVRMYASLADFVKGWRRNFRAGMSYSYPGTGLEIALFIAALLGGGRWPHPLALALTLSTLFAMAPMQKSLGRFSRWGLLAFPFALGLFCYVSVLAVFDLGLRRPMIWKNRSYSAS